MTRERFCNKKWRQDAQLSQRDCAARSVSFSQKWKSGTGRIFYGHQRSIFNHCDIIGLQSYQIRWKKCKIMAITLFQVIKVGTNRKPVCDFLLAINSNLPHLSPFPRYNLGKVQNSYIFLPLFGLTPRRRGSPGTISIKFYLDVVRSPTY